MLQVQDRAIAPPLATERAQAHDRPIAAAQEQPSNFTEGSKLLHDTFKHLTTLSTGSILLMVTLIQNLFKDKGIEGTALIGVAFACFIVAMLSATGLMIIIGDQLRGRDFYPAAASIWPAASSAAFSRPSCAWARCLSASACPASCSASAPWPCSPL